MRLYVSRLAKGLHIADQASMPQLRVEQAPSFQHFEALLALRPDNRC